MVISTSIFAPVSKGRGLISDVIPRIKKILKILEPTIFPTAISDFFFRAATIEVASSGRDVPAATIVSPITRSLMPSSLAIFIAPSTKI